MKYIVPLMLVMFLATPSVYADSCGLEQPFLSGLLDADDDQFTISQDCDDTDYQMYPGVWAEGTAGGYRECQPDGTFSTPIFIPTEAAGAGQDYFIDCNAGFNGNGSFTAPWNTTEMFTWLFPAEEPPGHHSPVAGDVFWISGTCTQGFDRDGTGTSYVNRDIIHLRNSSGTAAAPIKIKALPGGNAVLQVTGTTSSRAINLEATSYVQVDGFEILGTIPQIGNACTLISSTDHTLFYNNYIHNCHGNSDNNIAGTSMSNNTNATIRTSKYEDNWDITQIGNSGQNDRNIVAFGGDNDRFHSNMIGYTVAAVSNQSNGACFGFKHGSNANSTWEFDHNILYGCPNGVETSQAGGFIHNNHITAFDSGLRIRDVGAPQYHPVDMLMQENTIFAPTCGKWDWNSAESIASGNIFRDNICIANTTYGGQQGIIEDTTFGDDTLYGQTANTGAIDYINNTYDNQGGPLRFSQFESTTQGPAGGAYTFAQWQALGYDEESLEEDPLFDACDRATSPGSIGKGYHQSVVTTKTIQISAVTNGTEGINDAIFEITLVGGAAPVGGVTISYTITGTATNGVDYQTLSGQITFPEGSTSEQVIIDITDDSDPENTESVQIQLQGSNDPNCVIDLTQNSASVDIIDDDEEVPPATGFSYWWRGCFARGDC